jgi:NAD(P)H dehydrogenase (quinone)
MIVITGASGQLGRQIVEHLLERMDAAQVAVSVRDPAKVDGLGVRVRRGDYEDPESLRAAFDGASQVLLVSAATVGEAALRQHRNAIEAARAVGVERVVYTSHQNASPSSAFAPGVDHAATEALLGDGDLALRNGFYASSGLMLLGTEGDVVAPEDGPVSWTTREDLAEAAALILAGRLDVREPLTGGEALDFAALAELDGRRRVVCSDEEYVARLVGSGTPEPLARMLLGMFVASRAGEFNVVDPALERLLGRPPRTMREALSDAAGRAAAH